MLVSLNDSSSKSDTLPKALAHASPTPLKNSRNYHSQSLSTGLVLSTLFTEIDPAMDEFGFELQEIPEISTRLQEFIKKRQTYMTPNLYSPAAAFTGILKSLLDLLGNLKLEFRPSVAHGEDTPQFVLEPNPFLPLLGIAKALEDSGRRATTGFLSYGKALQYISRFNAQIAAALRRAFMVTGFSTKNQKKPPGA